MDIRILLVVSLVRHSIIQFFYYACMLDRKLLQILCLYNGFLPRFPWMSLIRNVLIGLHVKLWLNLFNSQIWVDLTFHTCACLPKAGSSALCWSHCWWDFWSMAHSSAGWSSTRVVPWSFITHICNSSKPFWRYMHADFFQTLIRFHVFNFVPVDWHLMVASDI